MDTPLESTTPAESVDLGSMYRAARERIGVVIAECGPGSADVAVAACPGWTVKNVVSHLVGIIEDVNAGRLSGPPPDEQTAEEVARHRTQPMDEVLASWSELAPGFEALITQMQIWPGLLDVLSHEHDIRAALGRPGARDDRGVMLGAEQLVAGLDAPVEIVITADPAEATASLRTTRTLPSCCGRRRSRCSVSGSAAARASRCASWPGPAIRATCSISCSSSGRPRSRSPSDDAAPVGIARAGRRRRSCAPPSMRSPPTRNGPGGSSGPVGRLERSVRAPRRPRSTMTPRSSRRTAHEA